MYFNHKFNYRDMTWITEYSNDIKCEREGAVLNMTYSVLVWLSVMKSSSIFVCFVFFQCFREYDLLSFCKLLRWMFLLCYWLVRNCVGWSFFFIYWAHVCKFVVWKYVGFFFIHLINSIFRCIILYNGDGALMLNQNFLFVQMWCKHFIRLTLQGVL